MKLSVFQIYLLVPININHGVTLMWEIILMFKLLHMQNVCTWIMLMYSCFSHTQDHSSRYSELAVRLMNRLPFTHVVLRLIGYVDKGLHSFSSLTPLVQHKVKYTQGSIYRYNYVVGKVVSTSGLVL